MAKKLVKETAEQSITFNENVDFSSEPSKNVKDSWNQITLSLATNGGFTHEEGRKLVLDVLIQDKINGKTIHTVKSFFVTKKELADLEGESREFSAEIETMLVARDLEESKSTSSKDTVKDTKKKEETKKTSKGVNEMLKKSLDSVRKKDPIVTYGSSEDDNEDPDDNGIQDSISDDEYLARVKQFAEEFARLAEKDESQLGD